MKQTTIPAFALKIVGLVLVVVGLPQILPIAYGIILLCQPAPDKADAVSQFLRGASGVVFVCAGMVLFLASRAIASRLLKNEEMASCSVTVEELQRTLYSCIGLFASLRSVPAIIAFVGQLNYYSRHNMPEHLGLMERSYGVGNVVLFVLGIVLFLGVRGLVGFRNVVRNAGLKHLSEPAGGR